jgi:ATP-dependent Clp protease ATP-binding subunit ClpC
MEIERDVANKKDVKNPTLEEFGVNLTIKAINGELDKVFGRDNELEDLIKILSRKKKNNAIMVSYPGVGKTSMVFLLAQRIVEQKVPTGLLNKVIYSLDSASLTAGTKYRGEMEERVKKILKEAEEDENIMLFIDEIHTILDSSGNNAMNISNIMKPHLTSGKLQVLGATTFDEFSKFFEKDSALSRRFNRLTIEEPSIEACEVIIKQCIGSYEQFHNVSFSDEIIKQIPILAKKYIKDRYLPDSAIDIIDELGAKIKVERTKPSNKLIKMLDDMEENQKVKLELIKNEDWETISTFKPQVLDKLKNKITYEQEKFNEKINNSNRIEISKEDLLKVVSKIGKVPLDTFHQSGKDKLKNLEIHFNKNVVGQEQAKESILKALKRNVLNMNDKKRPISVQLFLGPTGVGKTHIINELAKNWYDGSLIRIDMSEYAEKIQSTGLLGVAPGFVGYDNGGQLSEKIRQSPYSIVLLDEIEKADVSIYNKFLQIFSEGIVTDGQGRQIDCTNCIFIMTSNLGSQTQAYQKPGFGQKNESIKLENNYIESAKKFFTPELWNRIDTTVVFESLNKDSMYKLLDIELDKIKIMLKDTKITFNKKLKDILVDKGYEPKYGARNLKRTVESLVLDEIVNYLIDNDNLEKISVSWDEKNEKVVIN